ncbi:MAG: hypothetical protein ACOCZ5_02655 [bacterium]
MNHQKLDWKDIEIGDELQFEEKYYFQAYVTIVDKKIINDKYHDDYYEYELKIDKIIHQTGDMYKEGDTFTVGKSLSEGLYLTSGMKFKERGSFFDYSCGVANDR